MPDKIAVANYRKLVTKITLLFEGVRRSLVDACWKTGRDIVLVEQKGEIKAAYGTGLLQKLSEDLSKKLGSGFSERNLERIRAFYLQNRISTPASKLSLAHYFELLPVQDKKKRLQLEAKAVREGLKRDELRTLVRHEKVRAKVAKNLATLPENREPPDLLPVPKLGQLNAYQIKDPKETAWPDKQCLLLDHGFKGYQALTSGESRGPNTNQSKRSGDWGRPNYRYGKEIKSLGGLKAGDIVEWTLCGAPHNLHYVEYSIMLS